MPGNLLLLIDVRNLKSTKKCRIGGWDGGMNYDPKISHKSPTK
jgi:hypothetical protein